MNRIRYGRFLTIFGTILVLNFTFFAPAFAQDLHMVPEKGNVHPKMTGCLKKLEGEYKKGAISARLIAQGQAVYQPALIQEQKTMNMEQPWPRLFTIWPRGLIFT